MKKIAALLAMLFVLSFPFTAYAQITKDEYYARSTLEGNELEFYDYCYDEILNGTTVIYDYKGLDEDDAARVFAYVQGDCPELIRRDGVYTDAEAEELSTELDRRAQWIADRVPEDATDYEKVKYAYDWVTQTIAYGKGDTEQSKAEAQTIVGGLMNQEAVCAGISRTMQYILYKLDVLSYRVDGDTRFGPDHAWLIVRVDGDWYWCDPTNYTTYDYFLMDDSFLDAEEIVIDSTNPPLPACTSDKYMQPEPTPTPTQTAEPTPTPSPTVTPAPVVANVEPQEPPTSGGNYTGWIIAIAAVGAVVAGLAARARRKKKA
jgi:cell division septation protein DedD